MTWQYFTFADEVPDGMVRMYAAGTTEAQIASGTAEPTHYAMAGQLYQKVQQNGQTLLQPVKQPSTSASNPDQVCFYQNCCIYMHF